MVHIRWQHYPSVALLPTAKAWLVIQANLGLAANTIEAYGRALEDYLQLSSRLQFAPVSATREHIAAYIRDLTSRQSPLGANVLFLHTSFHQVTDWARPSRDRR